MTCISSIPQECLLAILAEPCLTVSDLAHCCQVSRQWRQLASDDVLWKLRFPIAAAQLIPEEGMGFKEQLSRSIVTRQMPLSGRLAALVQRVLRPGNACELTCQSLLDPDCRTIIQFGFGPRPAAETMERRTLFSMDPVLPGGKLYRSWVIDLKVADNKQRDRGRRTLHDEKKASGSLSDEKFQARWEGKVAKAQEGHEKKMLMALRSERALVVGKRGFKYCWSRVDHQYKQLKGRGPLAVLVTPKRDCVAPFWDFNSDLLMKAPKAVQAAPDRVLPFWKFQGEFLSPIEDLPQCIRDMQARTEELSKQQRCAVM